MITEKDLQEAINDCEMDPNPTSNTCIKLAAYYTLLDRLHRREGKSYSFSSGSESEFMRSIKLVKDDALWSILDEAMDTLKTLHPRLYNGIIRRLQNASAEG